MQLLLEKGETKFFSKATFYVAGENRTIGVERMVNLLQVASPFVWHMESIDRSAAHSFPTFWGLRGRL